MSISPAFLDEIRARVPISAVVGRKVKLQRAGREWKGCCPFHNEKTPSFYVNDEKAFYHCFGCGAHGDVVRFVCEAEGRTFREAVEQLANEAGLDMPREGRANRAQEERLKGLLDVMAAAQTWFADQLQGISGADARSYLQRRGLLPETIRRFGIGFAPDKRDALKSALLAKGASEAMLVEAGLIIATDDRSPYDRFRNRITFPIRDGRGRIIAFGGRILGDGQPKYLNSPDTPLFDKGRTLYNIDLAGPPGRKSGRIFVVEGYLDVITLAQAGIEAAVAPLGTALTEDHLRRLWRITAEPLLCFDGDSAGQRAAIRAAHRALPLLEAGKSLRFITLPEGKDPDDLVRSGGSEALIALAARAEPLVDLLWRSELAESQQSTPEGRAALKKTLLDRAAAIADKSVADLYRQEFLNRFDQLTGRNRDQNWQERRREGGSGGRFQGRMFGPSATIRQETRTAAQQIRNPKLPPFIVHALVLGLLEHPQWLDRYHEEIERLPIEDAELARLIGRMLEESIRLPDLDKNRLDHTLTSEGFGRQLAGLRTRHRSSLSFTREETDPAQAETDFVHVLQAIARLSALDAELAEAQSAIRPDDNETLLRPMRIAQERVTIERELSDLAASGSALRT